MNSTARVDEQLGSMIGAWGFRFFESDHDLDIVMHLSADCGLWNPDEAKRESLLTPKDPERVRKHLNNGELSKMFNKYLGMLRDYKVLDIKKEKWETGMMLDSPRYYMFILGLLAMQLGCVFPKPLKKWMRANVAACLFNGERLNQGTEAITKYVNGKPLELGSKTLHQSMLGTVGKPSDDSKMFTSFNVPNDAVFVSTMRMRLDNVIAQNRGGTGSRGVDISAVSDWHTAQSETEGANVYNTKGSHQPTSNASEDADMETEAVDRSNKSEGNPTASGGTKMYGWGSDPKQDERIADHQRVGSQVELMDTAAFVALLRKADSR